MLFLVLIQAVFILIGYYLYLSSKTLKYWANRGVKYHSGYPLVGNLLPFLIGRKSGLEFITDLYTKFPNERYCGFFHFTTPVLLLRDPELIKNVTIKHFDNFTDHSNYSIDGFDLLWSKNLFASIGERWRDLRQTLSPAFTSSKMRAMFTLMDVCVQNLIQHFDNDDDIITVDMKDLSTRFGNDVIASTAFGITCDSFRHHDHEFLRIGRELVDFTGFNKYKFFISMSLPKLAQFLRLKFVSDKVGRFFQTIISETIRVREEKQIVRHDMINLLMMARQGRLKYEEVMSNESEFAVVAKTELKHRDINPKTFLSDEDITAQALIFFFGGYDTTSTVVSFLAHELAVNADIQARLRAEIQETDKECHGRLNYERLVAMKYMDMVVSETLRKWTVGFFQNRRCTQDFVIRAEREGETDVEMRKGDVCWIPAWEIQHDEQYYPDPDKFDPERFNDANKGKIAMGTYLPFGIGPRSCIASRFALLENKILVYNLLKRFEIVPVAETQIPLRLARDNFNLAAEYGIHLGLKPIRGDGFH